MQVKAVGDKVRLAWDREDESRAEVDLPLQDVLSLLGEKGPKGFYVAPLLVQAINEARLEASKTTRRRIDELEAEAKRLRETLP